MADKKNPSDSEGVQLVLVIRIIESRLKPYNYLIGRFNLEIEYRNLFESANFFLKNLCGSFFLSYSNYKRLGREILIDCIRSCSC